MIDVSDISVQSAIITSQPKIHEVRSLPIATFLWVRWLDSFGDDEWLKANRTLGQETS